MQPSVQLPRVSSFETVIKQENMTHFTEILNVQWPCFQLGWNSKLSHWLLMSWETNKKFELMLTRCAKAYSSSCSQTVSLSPATSSRLLRGYHSLMPSCAGFLEPKKSRLGPLKIAFNAENSVCSLSMSISIGFGAIWSWNVSRSLKSPKKIHKTPYFSVQCHSRSLNLVAIERQCTTFY